MNDIYEIFFRVYRKFVEQAEIQFVCQIEQAERLENKKRREYQV